MHHKADAGQSARRMMDANEAAPRGPTVWPLHPFLLAAASVLAATTPNLGQMDVTDMLPVLAAALAGTAIVFLALAALIGRRAAIPADVIIIGSLYFGEGALPVLLVLVLLLAVAGAVSAWRLNPTLMNAPLNAFALVLFLTPAWKATWYEWETAGARRVATRAAAGATAHSATVLSGERPDIYYFIFDRYGSERVLRRELDFDNSPFIRLLEERGFYVAPDSHSNYSKTAPSLASTFHMDYLDFLVNDPLAKRNEWHPIFDMVRGEHRVGRFLKERGYHFIQIGSWWGPTQDNALADESYSFGLSDFGWSYLRQTILPPLLQAVIPRSGLAKMMAWDHGQCRRVPLQAKTVKEIGHRPGATFTFVHVLVPHFPFVFDAQGTCRQPAETSKLALRDLYVAQIGYANRLMREIVTSLLEGPGPKPVIILQGDEGPYPAGYRTGNRSWRLATAEEIDTKSGILNAYYFPDKDYSKLYPDITPVNSFRLLFNRYFGAEYALLPDRVFHFTDHSKIYDFFDVTDKARSAVDNSKERTPASGVRRPERFAH